MFVHDFYALTQGRPTFASYGCAAERNAAGLYSEFHRRKIEVEADDPGRCGDTPGDKRYYYLPTDKLERQADRRPETKISFTLMSQIGLCRMMPFSLHAMQ
jgi:hypothetical protein